MPDRRSKRGAHPQDARLFAASELGRLQQAVSDLSWLLEKGYADRSALKLVGDRYRLRQRQRTAVIRSSCSDADRSRRREHLCPVSELHGHEVQLDGYNVLTTVEAALAGGVLLLGRDGCLRDMASMHGSFRKVAQTPAAAALIGRTLAAMKIDSCRWLLDRPVSNSGRLGKLLEQIAGENQWRWQIQLVADPDKILCRSEFAIATADSVVLNHCPCWVNLATAVVDRFVPEAAVLDLGMQANDPAV